MKKILMFATALAMTFTFYSCDSAEEVVEQVEDQVEEMAEEVEEKVEEIAGVVSGSMEEDAKAMADLACESIELMATPDDPRVQELEEKKVELETKFQEKYPEGSDEALKMAELMEKELENCEAFQSLFGGE